MDYAPESFLERLSGARKRDVMFNLGGRYGEPIIIFSSSPCLFAPYNPMEHQKHQKHQKHMEHSEHQIFNLNSIKP